MFSQCLKLRPKHYKPCIFSIKHKILSIWMIGGLLMRNYSIKSYAIYPQLFWGWKTESTNLFTFRMCGCCCPDRQRDVDTNRELSLSLQYLPPLFINTVLGRHLYGSFLKHTESKSEYIHPIKLVWYLWNSHFWVILLAAKWTHIWRESSWRNFSLNFVSF